MFVRRLLTGQHKPIPVPQTPVYYYHISQLTKMVRVCYYKIINKTMNDEKLSDCCKEKIHDCPKFGKSHCVKCSKKCDVSTPPTNSNWEEEFKSLYEDVLDFPVCCSGGISGDVDCACNGETVKENIIIYIKNLLEQTLQQERQLEREKMIEEVEKLKLKSGKANRRGQHFINEDDYNDALDKVLDIIKNKE